jgi:hypothetical protein
MVGASVFITSLWVAICAVAPEFIWQGFRIAYEHRDWSDLFSALLIGLILAFFVEPATERIRDLLHRARKTADVAESRPRNVFFTACLSLAFALTSVGLHDAMTAFITGHGEGAEGIGIAAGISLTTEWAVIPFAMMLAWQCARPRWIAVPTGVVALADPWRTPVHSAPLQRALPSPHAKGVALFESCWRNHERKRSMSLQRRNSSSW